jgi:shikimate kinase
MDHTIPEPPLVRSGTTSAVALIGFMGAGKTTVGRELALRLGWRFQDLDELIEAREGRTIDQIFREDGEAAFRKIEHAALRQVIESSRDYFVLAVGGGAFINPGAQRCLQEAGIPAVFLDAPISELFRRCEQPGGERPLRRTSAQFHELYERRRPEYLKAEICIDTQGKPIAAVAEEIASELNLGPISGARD